MSKEEESFWDAGSFTIVTDRTKPAMKWTVDELTGMRKRVYVVDISDKPDAGASKNVSELPTGIECAIIGVTKVNPADIMADLEKKGIKKFWIHWRTGTPEVKNRCSGSQIQCITGKCPMMYLARGFNIHTIHRGMVKLIGKY